MTTHLMLIAPSGNRVYTAGVGPLAAAELEVCGGFEDVRQVGVAGVEYLAFETDGLDADALRVLGGHSTHLATFERAGTEDEPLLRPVAVPDPSVLDDDLVTIPKYQGKTNELFTRLLLNVTLAQVRRQGEQPLTVLDPLCGRGTTLTTAWLAGHSAAGVDADVKAVEQTAAFLRTWLRRKRLKHTADVTPVRRDGRSLGRRLDVEVRPAEAPVLRMTVFSGDTRTSAQLFGKRRFDAVVTDAPYGVVHGSQGDVRGMSDRRDRSPAALLGEAVPVWAGQLRSGGALGIAWNTLGMTREELVSVVSGAGLEVLDGGPWLRFAHRVDSSIHRDLLVATRP